MSVILYKLFLRTRQTLLVTRFQSATERKLVTAMDEAPSENSDTISMRNNVTEILRSKNSTRYKQRWKRPWDEPKPEDGESNEKKAKSVNAERIKRKKMAVLLGYCGADYFGMQRNPGVRTIEEDLLKALLDAKYITEEDFNNQQNMQFQRSSRTDKGVSAARQVVSLKLPLELSIDEVNKRLPECIRVFGVKRVTNKFNSKVKCNGRTYSYTLPTYVFEGSANTLEERKKYRITQEKLEKVKNILSVYKGTKCYFNFTEKKHFQDPSASRYMMSFVLDRLFEHSDMEFAVLLVKGQSFMIHQIRKMVGLTIAIARGHTDMSTMDRAFSKDKVMIPTAPGLGLVLDKVHYDRYAAKHSSHDNLSWDEEEPTIMKFIEEQIYPYIVKGEIETDNMGLWLETKLNNHSYEPAEDIVCETEVPDVEKETNDSDDECEVTDKKSD